MYLCDSLKIIWHCLSLGLEWKLTFSSPVATAEFSKFAGILSAALLQHHLLGFEIASTGISSPPLALFVVMLPKAHLTSHSRMSDSRWVIHFSLSCIGEGNGNPLQCSCLENPRYGGAWWAAIYGVAQSQTRLSSSSSNRGLFNKIRDTKGIFHAKMGTIKDRNGMDLREAEDIKKRWQEYTEELYKKDLSSQPR